MNKWFWAIPIALILITAVAVGLLGARDVDLSQSIFDTKLSEAVSVTDSEALRVLDADRATFDAAYDAFVGNGNLPTALPTGVSACKGENGTLYFVLEDRPGAFVAIVRGSEIPAAAESLGADGHNVSRVQSELIGGWVYYAEYVRKTTFRDIYIERLEDGLTDVQKADLAVGAINNVALIFKDIANAPYPAEYCQGKYALCAELERADGSVLTVILDPKTKAFLGATE